MCLIHIFLQTADNVANFPIRLNHKIRGGRISDPQTRVVNTEWTGSVESNLMQSLSKTARILLIIFRFLCHFAQKEVHLRGISGTKITYYVK